MDRVMTILRGAVKDAFDPRMILAVVLILAMISLYFGFNLPGSRMIRGFVGVAPRNPTDSSGSG